MKKFLYFDSHCHMNHSPLKENFQKIYSEAQDKKVWFNIIGTNLSDSLVAIDLANNHEGVYCSVGIHPNDVVNYNVQEAEQELRRQLMLSNKIIAIGETGLDYYYTKEHKSRQKEFLLMHLKLAQEFKLPLQLHIRGDGAFEDIKTFIKENTPKDVVFIIHCFSGSETDVRDLQNYNCYFSFSGIVTFKNSKNVQAAASICPINKIIAETDAPWLSPEPERGQTNNPNKVIYVYEKLMSLNNKLTLETINNNITSLFNLK